jgi:hypothetical protein
MGCDLYILSATFYFDLSLYFDINFEIKIPDAFKEYHIIYLTGLSLEPELRYASYLLKNIVKR